MHMPPARPGSRNDERSACPRPVVLLCAHDDSSSLGAATLRDLGFVSAADVIGGFEAWVASGLPVKPAQD